MSSGIGGAILFSPLFMVVLELPPAVAIGTALLTQLFGFGSGVFAYRRLRLIDYALAGRLMMVAVPGAAVGVLCAGLVSGDLLRRIFACGILVIGVQLFRSYYRERRRDTDASQVPVGPPTLVDARGIPYHYSVRRPLLARVFGAGGGTLLGLISVGLAELLEYHLIVISRIPPGRGRDVDLRGPRRDAHRDGRPPLRVRRLCGTRNAHRGGPGRVVHDSRCPPRWADRAMAPDRGPGSPPRGPCRPRHGPPGPALYPVCRSTSILL